MLIRRGVPRVDVTFWRRGYCEKLKRPWLHYQCFQLSTYKESLVKDGENMCQDLRTYRWPWTLRTWFESSSEEEYLYSTSTVNTMSYHKLPQFKVKINGTQLTVMAGTGASVNLLDEVSFAKLRIQPEIRKANLKIFPCGSDKPLTLVGKCQCEVETDTKFSVETLNFYCRRKSWLLGKV